MADGIEIGFGPLEQSGQGPGGSGDLVVFVGDDVTVDEQRSCGIVVEGRDP